MRCSHSVMVTIAALCFFTPSAVSARPQADRTILNAAPSDVRPWRDSVLVGNTLYLSGHVGIDPKTGAPPASPEAEARLLLDDMKKTLAKSGMTMDDLVTVQVMCTDLSMFDAFNRVYKGYFHKGFPARSFMGSSNLFFGAHFEMTGIAIKH
jgi:2-iminobutanoate/2-iminopropanoate deaminase